MSMGIVRKIDELGRVVLPKEMRDELRIKNGDKVRITRVSGGVKVSPYHGSCWDDVISAIDNLDDGETKDKLKELINNEIAVCSM